MLWTTASGAAFASSWPLLATVRHLSASSSLLTALCWLYIGIADGMLIARVWACRYSRSGHAVGDAEVEPT